MGTRNLTIVHKNGEYKVAQYGQWDGYPEGLGRKLLIFLKGVDLNSFRKAIDNVSYYTKEDLKEAYKNIDEMCKNIPNFDWEKYFPQLSRDCGGDILIHIMFNDIKTLKNSLDFAANSLFCEWTYVIDLDNNTFEIYKGFNKEPLSKNERFYCLEKQCDNEFHPVKFIKSYDLNNLPTEEVFIAELTSKENEK